MFKLQHYQKIKRNAMFFLLKKSPLLLIPKQVIKEAKFLELKFYKLALLCEQRNCATSQLLPSPPPPLDSNPSVRDELLHRTALNLLLPQFLYVLVLVG